MPISAVVLAKNEEENIKDCLKSLSFCDEVVVIDDDSDDKTAAIAKILGAVVYKKNSNADMAEQRNFGLEKANYEWILFLDADERVSDDLAKEIVENLKRKTNVAAFIFRRIGYYFGKWLKYGEIGTWRSVRLVKKGSGKWKRKVHECFETQGEVEDMQNPILHYPDQNLNKLIDKINTWSTMHAKANIEEGKRSSMVKVVVWPVGHFLNNYLIRLGFRDGMHGFVVAGLMSFHSYLSWSKQWLLQKKPIKN